MAMIGITIIYSHYGKIMTIKKNFLQIVTYGSEHTNVPRISNKLQIHVRLYPNNHPAFMIIFNKCNPNCRSRKGYFVRHSPKLKKWYITKLLTVVFANV